MKTSDILLYGGIGLAAVMVLKPKTPGSTSTGLLSLLPGAAAQPTPVASNPASMVGINSGVLGGNGSFYTCSNYNQLATADPNLMNPNYQLTAAQQAVYMNNYKDLNTGLATWPGGVSSANIQKHWNQYGCAEKRIYYPMQPLSGAAWVAPPSNPKAASSGGGSSWISSALSIAGTVVALLGDEPKLNDADCQALFTMSAIIKDILPLYAEADPVVTRAISMKMDYLLTQYS